MRILRARGAQPAAPDGRADPRRFNPELSILGVALTMFDRRNNLSQQVADDVRACLGKAVFDTVCRATSACPRRRATACRRLIYDLAARARKPISRWPAS
jgi:cellulose biosynthesis protein BcsQ